MNREKRIKRVAAETAAALLLGLPVKSVSVDGGVEYENDEWPARCSGCGCLSTPRALGETPPGWSRGEYGQGEYLCSGCQSDT